MIRLDVADYCQNCVNFEADVELPSRIHKNGEAALGMSDTIVRCDHRKYCENIKRYLEREMRSNDA